MNCKYQINIHKWMDGELEGLRQHEFDSHLKLCANCQVEVKQIEKLNGLIRTSAPSMEASLNFEGRFWQKVLEREKESWLAKVLRGLDSLIPVPNFAQVLTILLMALFIGGTGGFVATANTILPEQMQGKRESVKYLSGFQEFAGVPSSSVAASYLRTVSERKPS